MADTPHTYYIAISYAFVAVTILSLIGHILWRDHTTNAKLKALSDDVTDEIDEDTDIDTDVDGL